MNLHFDKDAIHITITITGDPTMAATVQQILDTIATLRTSLTAVTLDVQGLKDQIAQGGIITQADMDNILEKLQGATQQAADLDAETP